jgi:rhodanese-related sulfurtransferase
VTVSELLAFAGNHPYLSLALAGLTLALVFTEVAGLFRGFKGVGPAALTALINRDNALVIDLRPMADFQKGHIPGSKNVQMSQFDPEAKQLAAARALPVVLVCKAGQTSSDAARRLRKAGFEQVYVLDGGIGAWQQADLPLAKGARSKNS